MKKNNVNLKTKSETRDTIGHGTVNKRMNTRTLVTIALLSAISIVLSRFCVIYFTNSLRLSFGNIPIIITGILFGPATGMLVGAVTDIVGSLLLSGAGWYPLLTVTPMLIGLVAGLLRRFVVRKPKLPYAVMITLAANFIGSICWSTYCLHLLYGMPIWTLVPVRAPFYIGVAILEACAIFALFKSRVFDTILRDKK